MADRSGVAHAKRPAFRQYLGNPRARAQPRAGLSIDVGRPPPRQDEAPGTNRPRQLQLLREGPNRGLTTPTVARTADPVRFPAFKQRSGYGAASWLDDAYGRAGLPGSRMSTTRFEKSQEAGSGGPLCPMLPG